MKLNYQYQKIIRDVDGLFKSSDGTIVFAEIKYNDDHDTGKFLNINRKFIKTWAGLINRLSIKTRDQFLPIIYYFNPVKRWGPIYTPSRNIMRGSQLFDQFFATKYSDVDRYLQEIGDDAMVLSLFDDLYNKIRNKSTQQKQLPGSLFDLEAHPQKRE